MSITKTTIAAIVLATAFSLHAKPFTFVAWNIGHFALGTNVNSSIRAAEVATYAKDYRDLLASNVATTPAGSGKLRVRLHG